MKEFDYGIMGEKKYGTDYFCYIKSISGHTVKVVADDGSELEVDFPRFHKLGNFLEDLGIESDFDRNLAEQVSFLFGTSFSTLCLDELRRKCKAYKTKEEKCNSKSNVLVCRKAHRTALSIPDKGLLNNVFIKLTNLGGQDDIYPGLHEGVCYPVFYGCLLDDNSFCPFDGIHSVEELSKFDSKLRWELWEERKPSCFMS